MPVTLEVFSDLSERLRYNFAGFPVYVRSGVLSQFAESKASCHWHPDLEVVTVLQGAMNYFVGGQEVGLEEGQAIFVNSQRLHYGYSRGSQDCQFLVFAIHPELLGNAHPSVREEVAHRFGDRTQDFLVLDDEQDWCRPVLATLRQLPSLVDGPAPDFLQILGLAFQIVSALGSHLGPRTTESVENPEWLLVWTMRNYIHQNYARELRLEDVAQSAAVCRSRCCKLFRDRVGRSPIRYLIDFRLDRAKEMLRDTDRAVAEIGYSCGFRNPSFFSSSFLSMEGCSPSEYRRKCAGPRAMAKVSFGH